MKCVNGVKIKIDAIVALIPDEWLNENESAETPEEKRQVYAQFLKTRFAASEIFIQQAKHAREAII